MTLRRFLLAAAMVLTALLLQDTVVTKLPLPGAAPDLLLVLVVAYALVEGPLSGMTTGFVAGLLADSLADHQLGRLALVYAVVGYATGYIEDDTERSTLLPFVAVAAGAARGRPAVRGGGDAARRSPGDAATPWGVSGVLGPLRCGSHAVRRPGPERARPQGRAGADAAVSSRHGVRSEGT